MSGLSGRNEGPDNTGELLVEKKQLFDELFSNRFVFFNNSKIGGWAIRLLKTLILTRLPLITEKAKADFAAAGKQSLLPDPGQTIEL
jgi:hypothetical protein